MEDPAQDTLEDYLGKLNIEGERGDWTKRKRKIDFILHRTTSYLAKAKHVCDIGLGDGYVLRHYAQRGLDTTGIDVSTYLIEHIRKCMEKESLPVKLICGNVATVALAENSLDYVTCLDVLEHIPGDGLQATIEMLGRSIQPDGVLIASLPMGENLDNNLVSCPNCQHKFHRVGHHHAFPSYDAIAESLAPHFKVCKMGDVPFVLFKSMVLNNIAFRVYNGICRAVGLKKVKTVYIVARPV